jgi:hypothetical protein
VVAFCISGIGPMRVSQRTYLKMYPWILRQIKFLEIIQSEFWQVSVRMDDGAWTICLTDYDNRCGSVRVLVIHAVVNTNIVSLEVIHNETEMSKRYSE